MKGARVHSKNDTERMKGSNDSHRTKHALVGGPAAHALSAATGGKPLHRLAVEGCFLIYGEFYAV